MEDSEKKSIYDLGLHETVNYSSLMIIRVPGGWIYMGTSNVFVPLNNEFKAKSKSSKIAVRIS